ncbi:MAG: TylF/MycF/NovP-related O-methyltransferase [Bacteroidota bacterium]
MTRLPFKKRLPGLIKGWIFRTGFYRLLHPFSNLMKWLAYISDEGVWIRKMKNNKFVMNDYYTGSYDYDKRFELYNAIIASEKINEGVINYFEFGVAHGKSFQWWIKQNMHPDSRFYGFDTFEGLPEAFGKWKIGEMNPEGNFPVIENDTRFKFYKGLFQDTLLPSLVDYKASTKRKVILLDADLFTATLFVLTQLYPYLQVGDIIIFDEFNVPLHEYMAFKIFVDSFYIDYEVLGAVNNYYCTVIKITGMHKVS